MVTIRPALSPEDITTARSLFVEYAASVGDDLCFQDFEKELDGLPGAYQPPEGALLLAERAGEAVGCVALRPLDPPAIAEIKRLYVRRAGRGAGAGRALIDAILAEARRAGYERVRLDTLPVMKEAQSLYRALGFVEIPAYRKYPVPGTIFMELALTAS